MIQLLFGVFQIWIHIVLLYILVHRITRTLLILVYSKIDSIPIVGFVIQLLGTDKIYMLRMIFTSGDFNRDELKFF